MPHPTPTTPPAGTLPPAGRYLLDPPRTAVGFTGADFLDAATHPVVRFQSTSLEPAGEGRWTVTGDLTIRGVTRPAC
jgi:hypothetical protein